jgi:RimJ/RimL family protein N-acetyltransferase
MYEEESMITVRQLDDRNYPVFEQIKSLYDSAYRNDVTYQRYLQMLSDKQSVFFGAFIDEKLVGMCTLSKLITLTRTAMILDEVVTHRDHRNKGVATALMEKIKEYITRSTWFSRIEGTCRVDNAPAWKVYQRAGFIDRHNSTFIYIVNRGT